MQEIADSRPSNTSKARPNRPRRTEAAENKAAIPGQPRNTSHTRRGGLHHKSARGRGRPSGGAERSLLLLIFPESKTRVASAPASAESRARCTRYAAIRRPREAKACLTRASNPRCCWRKSCSAVCSCSLLTSEPFGSALYRWCAVSSSIRWVGGCVGQARASGERIKM